MRDFRHLGGYDKWEMPPSGGQDVDLRMRLHHYAADTRSRIPKAARYIDGVEVCGDGLPNDFSDTRHRFCRGYAKVANCDPQALQGLSTTTDKL